MKEFVPYELALRMKQLGFDEPCIARYNVPGELITSGCYSDSSIMHLVVEQNDICEAHILAPLFQQAFRWFREKGYLISFSSHDTSIHDFYIKWQPSKSILSDTYDTYEEAETACLEKLVEIISQTN